MLEPINTSICPKNGWSITIPDCGSEIRDYNYNSFLKMVGDRLKANNRDEHGWRDKVVDMMCRQRPDIQSRDTELPVRDITGDDIKRWARTIWETWKSGAPAVSEEEQNRRAEICIACPKRGYVSCLGGCGALAQGLAEITIGSKCRYIPELHKSACLACGCELSTLIMWPIEILKKVDEETKFPVTEYAEGCWKAQGIQALESGSSPQPPVEGT